MRSLKAKRFSKVSEPWGLAGVWNKSMSEIEKREPKERNYLWATDASKSLVDTYLSMKATKVSNPPNPRSRRKFEAGDVFISEPGAKRAGYAIEDTVFINVHANPDDCQDMAVLESRLITPETIGYEEQVCLG